MTELDKTIAQAFASEGKQDDVNKVYLLFLQSLLYLPVKQEKSNNQDEPFSPLFSFIEGQYYLSVFDTISRLQHWAGELIDQIDYVEISGHDLINGMHEEAFLCLNLGTPYYKEFHPDEVKRLKMITSRIQQMKDNSLPSS